VELLLQQELPKIIKQRVPILAERVSNIVTSIILDNIALPELEAWRAGRCRTLDGAIEQIRFKCNENNIKQRLESSDKYSLALQDWVTEEVLSAIQSRMLDVCQKYSLAELRAEDVDVSRINPDFRHSMEGMQFGTAIMGDVVSPADMLAGIVAVVSAIVTFVVVPNVIGVVLGIVVAIAGVISAQLAAAIVAILGAIPGPGWVILGALAAVGVGKIVIRGWEGIRDDAAKALKSYNLPQWVRNRVSTEKIREALNESRSDVTSKIVSELKSEKSSAEIAGAVSSALRPQVSTKLKEIRYIIESR
jgi:uncharacterized protein YeeX (DUF496 family)